MTKSGDWKQVHADASEEGVLDHPLVLRAMEEFADNMGFKLEGLPRYGLMKIASYVAQVARARALGFDPDLLLLTAEEADAQALEKARMAVAKGKPVLRIDADGTTTRLD
jgi:hypothetical protein